MDPPSAAAAAELAVYLEEFNVLSVTLRILLATLCGGVLGIERGKANQAAGMRTHILVCLGATLIMLTGEYMFHKFSAGDPARLGAQVVSGIAATAVVYVVVSRFKLISDHFTHNNLWMRIYVEFHDPSCLETICNILQSCGVQVGEVTMNNPGNSGNYNAIILLKNLDNKSSSQIEEFLEHVTEIDTLKFLN
ncbi:MAG TPA: MgtC/SapB family protein [Candidatus Mediterraneibacter tabaqchaliae]|uniref:MgtC/SapB family protein n=1 Tax=Candidatus Mediterraneibacter tabaqchaliae TaxID=2838689 RepID=A0A9D2U2P8_9FIRM|nr:MgtC/SapB family protein [Candidatus Mediterraneibacter tabaqchaliae]